MTNGPSSGPEKNSAATDGSGTTAFSTCTPRTVHSVNIESTATAKRPYLRAADRRRQLLDAAGRLFDRHGFGGITMAGTATEAGVSRQLLYDHFGDLEALYEAFIEDRLARYRAALPDVSDLAPDEAAATTFGQLLAIAPNDRRVVRLLVADVGNTALDRMREHFRTQELSRWPRRAPSRRRAGIANTAMWATTSALLALADSVTAGEISEAAATSMAVAIVQSASRQAST